MTTGPLVQFQLSNTRIQDRLDETQQHSEFY